MVVVVVRAAGKLSCESVEALGKLPKQASATLKIALPKNRRDAGEIRC